MRTKLVAGFVPALLVLLFMYTGFTKLFAPVAFLDTLYKQPFPHAMSDWLAYAVPAGEITVAACLLFERTRTAGLFGAFGLLTLFTLYIAAILLHFFYKTPCSCGGVFRHLSWQQHLWVNILLTGLAITALRHRTKQSISLTS